MKPIFSYKNPSNGSPLIQVSGNILTIYPSHETKEKIGDVLTEIGFQRSSKKSDGGFSYSFEKEATSEDLQKILQQINKKLKTKSPFINIIEPLINSFEAHSKKENKVTLSTPTLPTSSAQPAPTVIVNNYYGVQGPDFQPLMPSHSQSLALGGTGNDPARGLANANLLLIVPAVLALIVLMSAIYRRFSQSVVVRDARTEQAGSGRQGMFFLHQTNTTTSTSRHSTSSTSRKGAVSQNVGKKKLGLPDKSLNSNLILPVSSDSTQDSSEFQTTNTSTTTTTTTTTTTSTLIIGGQSQQGHRHRRSFSSL